MDKSHGSTRRVQAGYLACQMKQHIEAALVVSCSRLEGPYGTTRPLAINQSIYVAWQNTPTRDDLGQVAPWTDHVNASTQYLHSSNSVIVCPKMRLKRSISDASPVALARLSLSFTVRWPLASITLMTSDRASNPTSLVRFVPHPKLTRIRPAK